MCSFAPHDKQRLFFPNDHYPSPLTLFHLVYKDARHWLKLYSRGWRVVCHKQSFICRLHSVIWTHNGEDVRTFAIMKLLNEFKLNILVWSAKMCECCDSSSKQYRPLSVAWHPTHTRSFSNFFQNCVIYTAVIVSSNNIIIYDMWGSHGDEDDNVLLRCDALYTRRYISTFRINVLFPSSGLRVYTASAYIWIISLT